MFKNIERNMYITVSVLYCTICSFGACQQTSIAADFAIWRRASLLAFPRADVTVEFTSISMPTSSTVTVSTVTLAMAWKKIRKQQVMDSYISPHRFRFPNQKLYSILKTCNQTCILLQFMYYAY